ncbi:hypothetical protein D3C71_1662990 [compost metagenome]
MRGGIRPPLIIQFSDDRRLRSAICRRSRDSCRRSKCEGRRLGVVDLAQEVVEYSSRYHIVGPVLAQDIFKFGILPALHLLIESGRHHNGVSVFARTHRLFRLRTGLHRFGNNHLRRFRRFQQFSHKL